MYFFSKNKIKLYENLNYWLNGSLTYKNLKLYFFKILK